MEVCLDTSGECSRCDADGVLATVAGVRSEPTQMQECEVFKWRRRYKRSSMETVISTRMSHKANKFSVHGSLLDSLHHEMPPSDTLAQDTACSRTRTHRVLL